VLKRFDDGLARGEATLAGLVLLSMVLFAAVQVVVDNSAVRFEAVWAQDLKSYLQWIDDYLERATVMLAFLGASLAVRENKHILIDALVRVLPGPVQLALRGISMIVASVICYFLARVFYQAALGAAANDARERALDVYLVGEVHVCDAPAADLSAADLSRPDVFCAVRSFFADMGLVRTVTRAGEEVVVPVIDVGDAILRFVVPAMLLVMAVRFLAQGIAAFIKIRHGAGEGNRAPRPEAPSEDRPAERQEERNDQRKEEEAST
jgi:TRAP-type C4-dicarboxylate transport system permease small subunit